METSISRPNLSLQPSHSISDTSHLFVMCSPGPTRRDNRKSRYMGNQTPGSGQQSQGERTRYLSLSNDGTHFTFDLTQHLPHLSQAPPGAEAEVGVVVSGVVVSGVGHPRPGSLCSAGSPVWSSLHYPDNRGPGRLTTTPTTRARQTPLS